MVLGAALTQIEEQDADQDGQSNIAELRVGSDPADPESLWLPVDPVEGPNPRFDIGNFDPVFALRRVRTLYCGASPTYDQLTEMRDLPSEDERLLLLHDALDECLDSDYWRTIGLFRLADPWVRPVKAFGPEADFEPIPGRRAMLADYSYDYRLFSYVMTGDRDVRDLVTARYHVEEADDGTWYTVEGTIPAPGGTVGGGQLMEPSRRAGLLTAQWTVVMNVLATPLPRVMAGHVYRTYLGMDIALMQGLHDSPSEPLDIDQRGVAAPACAVCHATLDPASYPFAYLKGIEQPLGTYDEERPIRLMPGWEEAQPQGVFLGVPVQTVVDVGAVIAESPAFHRTLAEMFYEHALGRPPGPGDFEEFSELWLHLPAGGYSINDMLHRLIETDAFGAV